MWREGLGRKPPIFDAAAGRSSAISVFKLIAVQVSIPLHERPASSGHIPFSVFPKARAVSSALASSGSPPRVRERQKGLWANPQPVPPWEWRNGTSSGLNDLKTCKILPLECLQFSGA